MGDRTYTSIEFSGVISEEQGRELAQLLDWQGCYANEGDATGEENLFEALKKSDSFYDSECNYAQMEDIEAWCGENDVAYLKTWQAGGDYGPGIEIWKPGMAKHEQCATIEDLPAVTLTELKKVHAAGTIDKLIADLERFDKLGPPLQVLNVEDWTPEICVMMAKRKLEVPDEVA